MDFQPRYAATGSGTAIMSNRLSYFYDLRGPSMTIDTGCSGSMVALHQACQSIIAGDSSLAFAGGAGLILAPNTMMPMTALNFLSPDGRSYTFDSRANGYGRGEGVGLVILKKLCDALRDNDPIRAVIRSTCLSQDGRTAGTIGNPLSISTPFLTNLRHHSPEPMCSGRQHQQNVRAGESPLWPDRIRRMPRNGHTGGRYCRATSHRPDSVS